MKQPFKDTQINWEHSCDGRVPSVTVSCKLKGKGHYVKRALKETEQKDLTGQTGATTGMCLYSYCM